MNSAYHVAVSLLLSAALSAQSQDAPREEAEGPDVIVVAEAVNPDPATVPTLRMVREKLWGKYFPMVSIAFPNVPDFVCHAWCYESAVDFLDAGALDGGRLELRHRDQQNPQVLILTTITPSAAAVELEARVELDRENHPNAALPDAPPSLNVCWQLRHAPGFASSPDPYPEFVRRCFLFTDRGLTFLGDTDRAKIPVQPDDSEHNNPPWVQTYVDVQTAVTEPAPTAWAGASRDRYIIPVIGIVSRDKGYLAAIANDSAPSMAQAWHDCLHNNPKWRPETGDIRERRWRVVLYAMPNDPKALLDRVGQDFQDLRRVSFLAEAPTARVGWKCVATRPGWIEIPDKVEWMKALPLGPFVRLSDGRVLTVDKTDVLTSRDEGVLWERQPMFGPDAKLVVGSERALIRTVNGVIVLVFMNMADYKWAWNAEQRLPAPDARLPVWAVRSVDEGRTWTDAQMIYDGYCGDIHDIFETRDGTIIAPVQELMYEDGRHALRPRYSTDGGKTWRRSNLLDIGGRGHHDGLIESTLAQSADGRVWMLCRTNLGRFWSAYSDDEGQYFRVLTPSDIPASSAPGAFKRLASGRLLLVWNRPAPEGAAEPPPEAVIGGDGQWSETRVSNYRAELSIAFSSDDGATWSSPAVIARRLSDARAYLAYCYVFEPQPGEIWITSMQGDLRLRLREEDWAAR